MICWVVCEIVRGQEGGIRRDHRTVRRHVENDRVAREHVWGELGGDRDAASQSWPSISIARLLMKRATWGEIWAAPEYIDASGR